MRAVLQFPRSVIIAVAGMVVLGCAVYFGIDATVNRAVSADADHKARGWAAYFIEHMPNLDALIATGRPDASQLERIATAEKVGDVFRFKLFDRRGIRTLVSDEAASTNERTSSGEDSKATEVLRTGISNVSLNDGTGKKNRPPLYVEAYVPIVDGHGTVHGVVEVYLDQTQTAALFKTTFAAFAIGLALVAALTFGLPTMAYLLRSRQASEARQRVEYLAHYEPMTGLLNRASFTDKLDGALQRRNNGQSLSLVFLDLDDFKAINDTHGHEAGDEFLKHVANCITQHCRETDIVARPGGDEFLLALTGRSELDVTALVERLMREVSRNSYPWQKHFWQAECRHLLGQPRRRCIGRCDAQSRCRALSGKARRPQYLSPVFRGFGEQHAGPPRVEQLIRKTAEQETFELHYQPLLQASNGACVGFEALLRLPDGHGGYIPPTTCVPAIEAMGLINVVGKWVIEEATRTAATWPSHLFVSVNLSVSQFKGEVLVGQVKNALASCGLRPKQLELEVTRIPADAEYGRHCQTAQRFARAGRGNCDG